MAQLRSACLRQQYYVVIATTATHPPFHLTSLLYQRIMRQARLIQAVLNQLLLTLICTITSLQATVVHLDLAVIHNVLMLSDVHVVQMQAVSKERLDEIGIQSWLPLIFCHHPNF